jgi:membrane protein YqaA with SNARE-associated domain
MKAGLVALSLIFVPTVANLLVSVVAVALGGFVAASPDRAAKIWGSQRLDNLAPERRPSFMRWYRVFGILLCVAGVLLAVDSIVLPNYRH